MTKKESVQMFKSNQFIWNKGYGFTGTAKKSDLIGKGVLIDRIAIKSTKTGVIKQFHQHSILTKGGKVLSITYMPNSTIPNRNSEEVIANMFDQEIKIVIEL